MARIAGIDGCRNGWVVVTATAEQLESASVDFVPDLHRFLKETGVDRAIIDMPIGFTSGPAARDVEAAMRGFLPGKTSSVFNTPCRQALHVDDYRNASEVNRNVLGLGLSKQTHAIFGKMREIDELVRSLGHALMREGHPEVTFAVMNGGSPVISKKRSRAGDSERCDLLEKHGIPARALVEVERHLGASRNDILDAAAMLWSAWRLVRRQHRIFPERPSRDQFGLQMSVTA